MRYNKILIYAAQARPWGAQSAQGQLLSRSQSSATMAARLIALMRDPETARLMGSKGRRVVEEKFSCEAQLARTEELYDRLLQAAKWQK